MTPHPRFVFAVLAALLLCASEASANREPVTLTDPIDGTEFEAVRQIATNALGGTDSDYCQYASGGNPREVAVATSPSTFYSALVSRFERELTDDQKKTLQDALASTVVPGQRAADLEPWERYQLAAICAGVLGETSLFRGDLYLNGGWTVRDRVVGFIPGVDGPLDVLMNLEVMDAEWLKIPDLRTQQMALFDLARVAHRGGFSERRDGYLNRLDELQPVPDDLVRARQAWMRDPIDIENRFLAKAMEHYEVGLAAGEGTAEEQIHYRYLIIDIKRRLGQTTGLTGDLNVLLQDPNLTDEIRVSSKSLLEALKDS